MKKSFIICFLFLLFCNTLFASESDDATCFDLIAVNYNDPKEGVYPMGMLFLVFNNYQTEMGAHLYKILDSVLPINNIEKLFDGSVEQGDLFKVKTYLPGGGTYYKFTFKNGKLYEYVMDMPEGGGSSGEYQLEKTFEFENISKLKLGTITITE